MFDDDLLKVALSARENNTDKERLIEHYKTYIQEEARKYSGLAIHYDRNYAVDIEDFISCGTEALLAAISEFPPEPPELVSSIDDYFKNAISKGIREYRNNGRINSRVVSELLNRPILTSKTEEQFRELALQAIDELPQQHKIILQMRIVNKYKFEDIGDCYSKSKEWARKVFYKIRNSLVIRLLQLAPNP